MKLWRRKQSGSDRRSSELAPRGKGVFSYYASRAPESSGKDRSGQGRGEPARRSGWHYIPSLIAAVVVLICLGYILKLDSDPKISLVGQGGIGLRTTPTYQQAAAKAFKRSWFNRNKLTVDAGGVERQLKQQFPELSEVSVTLPLVGHRPVVELAVVQPAFVLTSKGTTAVVASNGKVIADGPTLNDAALKNLPRVDDTSGLSVKTGDSVLPQDQVIFMQVLAAQFQLQKLNLQTLTLPAAPNEVDAHLQGLNYYIKFNTVLDVRQQVGTFLAVKQKLDSQHITPGEYVDVRVEEKAFYK